MPNRAAAIRQQLLVDRPGSTIVGRTRNGLRYRTAAGRNGLIVSGGPLHLDDGTEIDTDIGDTADTGYDHADVDALPFRFRFSNSGKRRIMPRRDHPTEYIEFSEVEGFNGSIWQSPNHGKSERVENRLQWSRPAWGIGYTVDPTGIKATYVAKGATGATDIRWAYQLFGLTRVGNTFVADSDAEVVLTLGAGTMWDSAEVVGRKHRLSVPVTVDATHVTMTPDYTGLTFPVFVDPTVSVDPTAGSDDGDVEEGIAIYITDTEAWLGNDNPDPISSWRRFPGVTVPNGATIDVAYITQISNTGGYAGSILSNIYGVDEDNHTAPTTLGEWNTDHGIHTTASVAYDFTVINANGTSMQTPSIVSIIQEIVDRGSWASGNAIGIHIDDDGTTTSGVWQLWASYENGSRAPANLHIEYTESGTAYDETGRELVITSTVNETDAATRLEPVEVAVASTLDLTDQTGRVDPTEVVVTSTLDLTDQADFVDPTEVTVASTIDGTAIVASTEPVEVTVASTFDLTDQLGFHDAVEVTVAATVDETDLGAFVATAELSVVATIDQTTQLDGADSLELDTIVSIIDVIDDYIPDIAPAEEGVFVWKRDRGNMVSTGDRMPRDYQERVTPGDIASP